MENQHHLSINYYVNGEREITHSSTLSVREILTHSEFIPVENWTLKSLDPKKDYGSSYNEIITIHEGERFECLHKGPTPVSENHDIPRS